ncbi:DEAD/DEAH box helicase [Limnochorda pilosa]|uniref:Ski2-like helicase n=1 Tax=Limnochorda pilosa TaxID=1555112 RepID=A0A0K2SML0_LIMPI|nr:DEAD/DEAH box helicase [Limnochorda pilosa]BAS28064.1 ski2-like helicase [Limnochorda pilosa]
MGAGARFPLYERAEQMGLLDGASGLVVAPTATGKSFIGRSAIRRVLDRGDGRTQVYLVPFRALAREIYESFLDELQATTYRIRIATGDHRDAIRPEESDLLVATYESFDGLLRRSALRPGVVVADEFHLVADETRGPAVEGLVARLLHLRRAPTLIALSAVVENADELARWLGVPLLLGSAADRPVELELASRWVPDMDGALGQLVAEAVDEGSQALVFCSSRRGAEAVASRLAPLVAERLGERERQALAELADRLSGEDDETGRDLAEVVPAGVAFHHAGLSRSLRQQVEDAYRDRRLRVLAATPTLAAGVNLPAEVAVVRDVFRAEPFRGRFRYVLLSSGELLNMMGRAARPGLVGRGRGLALLDQRHRQDPEVQAVVAAIEKGRGGEVQSRLPDSFEALMRFVLSTVVERGETTRDDIAETFRHTLAHHQRQEPIHFDRTLTEDLLEDIPAYEKVVKAGGSLRLVEARAVPSGVRAVVRSGDHDYHVTLSVAGLECDCPAAQKFFRNQICKHQACALATLISASPGAADPEVYARAVYTSGHLFTRTLDLGTRLSMAIDLLARWSLIERAPSGWRATPVGEMASASGFDLLLVHEAVTRIHTVDQATCRDVARWAVIDFFADEKEEARWLEALDPWLDEVELGRFRLPERYRGDFERRLEDLARVARLYQRAAEVLGKEAVARAAKEAAGAVEYGVGPELVPLMALRFPQLGRARARLLYERGVTDVQALAASDPQALADPRRMPARLVAPWVERAQEIVRARAVAAADQEEAETELDELLARFRVAPEALEP